MGHSGESDGAGDISAIDITSYIYASLQCSAADGDSRQQLGSSSCSVLASVQTPEDDKWVTSPHHSNRGSPSAPPTYNCQHAAQWRHRHTLPSQSLESRVHCNMYERLSHYDRNKRLGPQVFGMSYYHTMTHGSSLHTTHNTQHGGDTLSGDVSHFTHLQPSKCVKV